jgi:hypothetical protein
MFQHHEGKQNKLILQSCATAESVQSCAVGVETKLSVHVFISLFEIIHRVISIRVFLCFHTVTSVNVAVLVGLKPKIIRLVYSSIVFVGASTGAGIAQGYGLDGLGFESRQGVGIFHSTSASRPALGPI